MLYDGVNWYAYDNDGRLCATQTNPVTGGTVAFAYLYDAEGRRVAKGTIAASAVSASSPLKSSVCNPSVAANNFTVTESYVLGQSGEQLTTLAQGTSWTRTSVYGAGLPLATYDNDAQGTVALHFLLTDHLGSRRLQTDPAGTPETDCQSLPYGDALNCVPAPNAPATADDANPLHHTGKQRDAETGNDYFWARYYGSSMGRFMSPDSYGGRLADPQSLNKYAYARNNPLIYVDPDGHDFNLTGCGTTNTATCNNNMVRTTSTDGKNTFTATVISNGANGLQDQAGNAYSGTVTSAGVSFSQNGSNTSYGGSWINGSNDTSFSQTGGALNGFSFNFSQPNTATGQTLAGTFSYGDNMSASQAGKALEAAGFSHSYFDAIANPLHGYDVTHYRGVGDPKTGAGAAHFILDDPYKVMTGS